MHKLLDEINHISDEMKNMQQGFADSEKYVADTLRGISQDILKKTYDTEMSVISGSIEQIWVRAAMFIPKMIKPNNTIAENLSQGVIRGQNERDLQKNQIYLGYSKLSKKISHMNTSEIFEFLDTFSKKDLHNTIQLELGCIRQIPVVIVESSSKIDVVEPAPKRIEVLVPVKIKPD